VKHRENRVLSRGLAPKTPGQAARAKFAATSKEIAVERRARHAHLRYLITEAWVQSRPLKTVAQVRARLLQVSGIEAAESTIAADLDMLGAIRLQPEGAPASEAFLVLPPRSPDAEIMRANLSDDAIAIETETRIASYAVEMYPWRDMVLIAVERNCGQMLADILVLNPWPEMVHVQAAPNSIIIFCPSEKHAERLWLRLNRQYEEIPRFKNLTLKSRGKTGSFLNYFKTHEVKMEDTDDEGL
jgi:arginine repressor